MRRRSRGLSGVIASALRLGCAALACALAWVAHAREPAHPSLLFDAGDIARLQQGIEAGWMKQAFDVMAGRAKRFLDVSTDPYPLHARGTNGPATAGRALNNRVSTLAMTGMLSGALP